MARLGFSLKKRSAFLGGFFLPHLRRSLAVFCLFFGIIPLSSPARTAAKSQEFVVASYNLENYTLHSGERVRQKSIPAREAIADVVAEAHPDILGVCELASPEALADLRERLAERGITFLDTEFVNGPDPIAMSLC